MTTAYGHPHGDFNARVKHDGDGGKGHPRLARDRPDPAQPGREIHGGATGWLTARRRRPAKRLGAQQAGSAAQGKPHAQAQPRHQQGQRCGDGAEREEHLREVDGKAHTAGVQFREERGGKSRHAARAPSQTCLGGEARRVTGTRRERAQRQRQHGATGRGGRVLAPEVTEQAAERNRGHEPKRFGAEQRPRGVLWCLIREREGRQAASQPRKGHGVGGDRRQHQGAA